MKLALSFAALVTGLLTAPRLFAAQTPVAQQPAAPAAKESTASAEDANPAETRAPTAVAPADTPTVPPVQEKKEPKDHSVYVSISPIHLILPVVELTTEVRLHERVGVAVIGGVGSVKAESDVATAKLLVWEAGGQIVTYPVGHFDHGMQLGAEVLYVGASGSASAGGQTASGTGQGLALSPFVGYKFTAPIGFAFNIQGGVSYYTLRAEAKSGGETASTGERSSLAPLINLNLGWAF